MGDKSKTSHCWSISDLSSGFAISVISLLLFLTVVTNVEKKKESEAFMSQRKHFWVLGLPLYGLVFFEILTLLLQSFDSFLIFVRYFFGIFHSFKKLSSWRELQKLFYIFISKRIRIMTNNVYLIRIINPH